jgi:hypothetical protein
MKVFSKRLSQNIGFPLRNIPFASKRAEGHFTKAIEVAKQTRPKDILDRTHLDFDLLHNAKLKKDQARERVSETVRLFEQCGAKTYMKQTEKALESLG